MTTEGVETCRPGKYETGKMSLSFVYLFAFGTDVILLGNFILIKLVCNYKYKWKPRRADLFSDFKPPDKL
jgi:hypothetical protein